jgi:hypothetical protein
MGGVDGGIGSDGARGRANGREEEDKVEVVRL